MKITAEPRSDQWNADDFIGGPRTFTIGGVKVGTAEQKYDIELVEGDGRFWRPPLTMLRLLIAAWGDDAAVWTGRRVTLYRDETVRFGSDAVGGIRISHMSHLPGNKPLVAMLTSTRGRRARHVAEPLPDEPTAAAAAQVPLPQRIAKVLTSFKAIGITEAQIVAKLGKPSDQWDAGDVAQAGAAYTSITKGGADKAEVFPDDGSQEADTPPAEVSPADVVYVSKTDLAKLKQIRDAERYDDDEAWFDYVHAATGARVTDDEQLHHDQARTLIDLFNEDTQ